jgi:hypothetical protein
MLTPTPDSDFSIGVNALDYDLADTSVQVQGRSTGIGGFLLVSARNQVIDNNIQYFGVISYQPSLGGTIMALGRGHSRGLTPPPAYLGGFPVLPFDIREEDGILQLDVIGDQLSLWAWRAGDPKPSAPQLVARDRTHARGFVRVGGGIGDNNDGVTTIRYVRVARSSIPEPSALMLFVGVFSFLSFLRGRRLSR